MQSYEARPPDVVKSVRQRWLLGYWARLRCGRALPRWRDLDTAELDSCADDLTIVDVLPNGPRPLLRIHDHGKNVGAMYAGQCAGKYLADTLPESVREAILDTYEQAARLRLPVYTVSGVLDAEGRPVIYERLLLPFSDFGQHVSRIIGFLEAISPDGAFERRELMTAAVTTAGFKIRAVLHPRT